jgi:hypothetical protein
MNRSELENLRDIFYANVMQIETYAQEGSRRHATRETRLISLRL